MDTTLAKSRPTMAGAVRAAADIPALLTHIAELERERDNAMEHAREAWRLHDVVVAELKDTRATLAAAEPREGVNVGQPSAVRKLVPTKPVTSEPRKGNAKSASAPQPAPTA